MEQIKTGEFIAALRKENVEYHAYRAASDINTKEKHPRYEFLSRPQV